MGSSRAKITRIVALILAPAALFTALVAWGASSPIGASPDEDYHLTSIWCGVGEREGFCEPGSEPDRKNVPSILLNSSHCFAFNADQAASCPQPAFDVLVDTDRGNFRGDYPPLFYGTMGLFASEDVSASVLAMRTVNAALYVALLSVTFLLIPVARRGALVWGSIATLVPLGMFLVPSINPSSWSIISVSVLWIALLGYFEANSRKRRVALALIAALAFVLGVGSRGDSAAYAAVAAVLAIVLTARRSRRYLALAAFPLAMVVAAVATFFSLGQSNAIDPNHVGAIDSGRGSLLFSNLLHLPELWAGAIGTWGLGWLDTPLPGLVWFPTLLIFSGVLFWGLQRMDWRKGLSLAAVGTLLVLLPLQMLLRDHLLVGEGVQPRYIYPLLILLVCIALLNVGGENALLSRTQLAVVAVGLSVANGVAQHINLRRYVTGLDLSGLNLDKGAEWWWGLPLGPLAVWIIGSFAFAVALFSLAFAVSLKPTTDQLDARSVPVTSGATEKS